MADGGGSNEEMGYAGGSRGRARTRSEEEGRQVHLDIGLGDPHNLPRGQPLDWPQPPGEGACFSLRHFLRDSDNQQRPPHSQGEGVLPPGTPPPSPRLDMASALPDFVQDHLVMEQSYLGSASGGNFRLDNLPQHLAALQREADFSMRGDIPFDLMASNPPPHHPQQPETSAGVGGGQNGPDNIPSPGKALPDFLSDGPIRREVPQQSNSMQIENERLQTDNERMRLELDMLRQQLSQQIQRNESLEVEMNRQMNRERVNTTAQPSEKLEDELFKMTKRALMAENRVVKLKEYVETLRVQSKQRCNSMTSAASTSAQQTQSERLASQLRNAANTAEISLRQLLNGVDNLRHLADSLEPSVTPPSKTTVITSDSDEDFDDDDLDDESGQSGRNYR